jgi:hypothetical protein
MGAQPHVPEVVEEELPVPERSGSECHQVVPAESRTASLCTELEELAEGAVTAREVQRVQGRGHERARIGE